MLVPTIVNLSDNHWHKILQESLVALKTILKEIDQFAFDNALKLDSKAQKKFRIKQSDEERNGLDKKWDKLDRTLKTTNSGYHPPKVPFSAKRVIKDFNSLYAKVYDKERFINS